jgi:hypothetical protein
LIDLVSSVSILYTWTIVCILVFFLFLIARFYEEKSGRRTFYSLFLIPIVLFLAAAIKYAFPEPSLVGDFWGDLLRFVGGVILGGAGLFLLRLMIGGRS